MILELLVLSNLALATPTPEEPVVTHVSAPVAVVPQSREITLTPKCEQTEINEGYHEDVMVKKVCCSMAGKSALSPIIAKTVGGAVLRVAPLDSRTSEIYERGCTTNLETTNILLRLRVTYLP